MDEIIKLADEFEGSVCGDAYIALNLINNANDKIIQFRDALSKTINAYNKHSIVERMEILRNRLMNKAFDMAPAALNNYSQRIDGETQRLKKVVFDCQIRLKELNEYMQEINEFNDDLIKDKKRSHLRVVK